jgi:hypothetical protein
VQHGESRRRGSAAAATAAATAAAARLCLLAQSMQVGQARGRTQRYRAGEVTLEKSPL